MCRSGHQGVLQQRHLRRSRCLRVRRGKPGYYVAPSFSLLPRLALLTPDFNTFRVCVCEAPKPQGACIPSNSERTLGRASTHWLYC